MRLFCAALAAASLLTTTAFAGDLPLPAGKPAGIKTAQDGDPTLLYLIGGAAIVAGIVILATNNSNSTLATGATTATTGT